jgi:hypothetical protein
MKYELTKGDLKYIRTMSVGANTAYLKHFKNKVFNVGEILNKVDVEMDKETGEILSIKVDKYDNSLVTVKYLVIAVDAETNIAYIKLIKENGKLDDEVDSTWNPDDAGYNSYCTYEVDPGVVDSILLEADFDISSILKEERNRKLEIVKQNKENSIILKNLKEVNKFLEQVPAGKTLYYHNKFHDTYLSNTYRSFTLGKKLKRNIVTYSETIMGNRKISMYPSGLRNPLLNDKHIYYLASVISLSSIDLIGCAVYLQEPASFIETK